MIEIQLSIAEDAMAGTPVAIKINFANKNTPQVDQKSELITEWHIPRILGALSIVLALLILIGLAITDESTPSPVTEIDKPHAVDTQQLTLPVVTQPSNSVNASGHAEPQLIPLQPPKNPKKAEPAVYSLDNSKPAAVIYDRHVIRAALVAEINDHKPGARVQPNIVLSGSGSQELYYFTEIKHPTQSAYVHQWVKNGQQVLKKNLPVKGLLPHLISSKKFSLKDKGVWSVLLLDNKGKALSESRFVVN